MEFFHTSLAGLINFALYFACSLVLVVIFKFIYSAITPHDEWQLVKQQNVSAAIGFVGAQIGFALALGSAISNSTHILDFLLWGVIALIAQLLAFAVVRFLFLPQVSERITNNEISAGIILGGISVAVGILNAACLTY